MTERYCLVGGEPVSREFAEAQIMEDTRKYGRIGLTCRCGAAWLSVRCRYHVCPGCARVLDLQPRDPEGTQFVRA